MSNLLLLCTNASGTEKFVTFLGNLKIKDRELDKSGISFIQSKKGSKTLKIFQSVLSSLIDHFQSASIKMAIIIDNATYHFVPVNFSHICLIHLPPESTHQMQPLDLAVIPEIKRRIVRRLTDGKYSSIRRLFRLLNGSPYLDVLKLVHEFWIDFDDTIIKNAFLNSQLFLDHNEALESAGKRKHLENQDSE